MDVLRRVSCLATHTIIRSYSWLRARLYVFIWRRINHVPVQSASEKKGGRARKEVRIQARCDAAFGRPMPFARVAVFPSSSPSAAMARGERNRSIKKGNWKRVIKSSSHAFQPQSPLVLIGGPCRRSANRARKSWPIRICPSMDISNYETVLLNSFYNYSCVALKRSTLKF